MGKRTKWQPPHPPKDIGAPKRTTSFRTEPDPPQIDVPLPHTLAADDIDRILTERRCCIWPSCAKPKHNAIELCATHARVVAHQINAEDEAEAARATAEQDRRFLETMRARNADRTEQTPPRGYVYIVQVDDLIKIGYTARPEQRLRAYPPNATVLAVFPGSKQTEKELHRRFRPELSKGREWFRDAPTIREYVTRMTEEHGPVPPAYNDRFRDAPPPNHYAPKQYVGTRHYGGIKKTAA